MSELRSLSLVVPAYNEAERLPLHLGALAEYLSGSDLADYEVIVVDDGSLDATAELVARRAESWPQLSLTRLERNRGKGAAVRAGILGARGDLVLFTDADGATPIGEEARLREAILAGADLAVGSRLEAGARTARRRLCGHAFSRLVRMALPIRIRDTQCGFKMFRRDVARSLFSGCREDGYLFDLYILALAERLGYHTAEVEVRWHEVPGSKVRLVRDACRMVAGLPRIRRTVAEGAVAEVAARVRHAW